jgi:glycosyltransferase involved in cell wall biosynthesis
MKIDYIISVIIPTYNRSNYLKKIIPKLNLNNCKIEVIICDSFSKDSTKNTVDQLKSQNPNLNIKYLNVIRNNNSLKRNAGVKKSTGKYIVLIDDDCIPENNFLKNYFYLLKNNKNKKNIFCGSVKYSNVFKSNFVKYRQSKHFIIKEKNLSTNVSLDAKNIVTMNMAFKKEIIIKNKIFFNENFNRYGFEDYEFGFRLITNGFKIIPSFPLIFHHDRRKFELYLDKIKFLGLESMKYLIKLNFQSAKMNNFYKLESFILIKFLLNSDLFKYLLLLVRKICILIERKFFYFPFIYKIAIASAYLEGCFYRKRYNDKDYINNYWYK